MAIQSQSSKQSISKPLKLFAGSSHPALAQEIARYLKMEVSETKSMRFANGEIYIRPVESVRGDDVFVIQTCTDRVNEELMELFILLDSLKRSFSGKIHVVIPHYGYARQDRVAQPREPITAKLVADLISAAGADHVITMALHSDQEQGFFNFPVDNLNPRKLFVDYFKKKKIKDLIIVSTDAGGAKDVKKIADMCGVDFALVHKTRPKANVSEVLHVVGDVEGRTCLIYDDMIDTGGSVVNAAKALRDRGANKDMYLAAVHPVFSDPAIERLKEAKFKEVVVSNTIPLPAGKRFPGLTVLSVAPLLAQIIENVHESKSVTKVFD